MSELAMVKKKVEMKSKAFPVIAPARVARNAWITSFGEGGASTRCCTAEAIP